MCGRVFMGDRSNGMSFHAFDKESLNYTWENGKTYTYPLESDTLDFIELEFGLQNNNRRLLKSYAIRIFPDGTKSLKVGVVYFGGIVVNLRQALRIYNNFLNV
jgi:hypothetical protein